GRMAAHRSWTKPGRVNSKERAPPPGCSSASSTATDHPARATVIAAARPFGPAPTTTALRLDADDMALACAHPNQELRPLTRCVTRCLAIHRYCLWFANAAYPDLNLTARRDVLALRRLEPHLHALAIHAALSAHTAELALLVVVAFTCVLVCGELARVRVGHVNQPGERIRRAFGVEVQ